MAADSSALSRSTQTSRSTPNLPPRRGDDGLPTLPLGSPHSIVSTIVPHGGGQLPDTPRADEPKKGWIGGRLARGVGKSFETTIKKFYEL